MILYLKGEMLMGILIAELKVRYFVTIYELKYNLKLHV